MTVNYIQVWYAKKQQNSPIAYGKPTHFTQMLKFSKFVEAMFPQTEGKKIVTRIPVNYIQIWYGKRPNKSSTNKPLPPSPIVEKLASELAYAL